MNDYTDNTIKEIQRRDIFYITNSKYYGTDPAVETSRPGIIVSCNELNEHSHFVEVVYLTTKEKKPMLTHVPILCKTNSTALCETIYTVSKDRLGDYVRSCSETEMAAIDEGLLRSLGITAHTSAEVEREGPAQTPVIVERNLYKTLYEDLLNKVVTR